MHKTSKLTPPSIPICPLEEKKQQEKQKEIKVTLYDGKGDPYCGHSEIAEASTDCFTMITVQLHRATDCLGLTLPKCHASVLMCALDYREPHLDKARLTSLKVTDWWLWVEGASRGQEEPLDKILSQKAG